jgi:hypothetical protein
MQPRKGTIMPITTDLPTVHAELIEHLKKCSAHLSNAAYYLEHPETYADDAKTRSVSRALIRAALMLADEWKLLDEAEKLG